MIEDKYIDMINAGFDGELDANEVELLDEFLASSEDGRAYRDELSALAMKLEKFFGESVSPPVDLKESILQAVAENFDIATVAKGNFRPVWLKPVLAMAASVLVAVLVLQLTSNSIVVDEGDAVSGSMVKTELRTSLQVDQPGLAAHVRLRRDQTTLILEIGVESETNTSTQITLPAGRYERLPENVADAGVVMTGNSLMVSSRGVFEISFFLKDREVPGQPKASETIHVKFIQEDKVTHAAKLRIPASE